MNEKALIKSIKTSAKKGRIMWQLKENHNFISNGHYAIKLTSLSNELNSTLYSIFHKFPENNGETLIFESKRQWENQLDIEHLIKEISVVNGKMLPFILIDEKVGDTRFCIDSNHDIFGINADYAAIFEGEDIEVIGGMFRFHSGVCMGIRAKDGLTWNSVIRSQFNF